MQPFLPLFAPRFAVVPDSLVEFPWARAGYWERCCTELVSRGKQLIGQLSNFVQPGSGTATGTQTPNYRRFSFPHFPPANIMQIRY